LDSRGTEFHAGAPIQRGVGGIASTPCCFVHHSLHVPLLRNLAGILVPEVLKSESNLLPSDVLEGIGRAGLARAPRNLLSHAHAGAADHVKVNPVLAAVEAVTLEGLCGRLIDWRGLVSMIKVDVEIGIRRKVSVTFEASRFFPAESGPQKFILQHLIFPLWPFRYRPAHR
jgi:hypothetical protein